MGGKTMNYIFISPNFPSNFKKFAIELYNQGIRVLGIGSENYEELDSELKGVLTEYYRVDSLEDYEQVLRACGFFTFKYGKIDRIESHDEYWLYLDAKLRTDFNVFGLKMDDMDAIKKKSKMKEVFEQANIPVARGRVVLNITEAKTLLQEIDYPVCIKPDIGVGAANTFKLENDEQLEEFFAKELHEDYIMEEFIEGEVHTFDGLTDKDGRVVFMNSFVYNSGVMELVNNNLDVYYYNQLVIPQELEEYGLNIVKAFGLKERFFHFEFFKTKAGNFIVLEANFRPPGGLSMDMFNYATDSDLYRIYAEVVQGKDVGIIEQAKYCTIYLGRKEGNNVKHVHKIESVLDKYSHLLVYNGPIASIFSAAIGSYGIILRAESREALDDAIRFTLHRKID